MDNARPVVIAIPGERVDPKASPPGEELGMALHYTRMIRFGLEAMWSAVDFLPDDVPLDPGVRPALVTINDWLKKVEEGKLRDRLLTKSYAVIRPVSLVRPPSPESLEEIKRAIGVLNRHAVLISDDLDDE